MCGVDAFDNEYEELLTKLDQLVLLLERHGEAHWVNWLSTDRKLLARSDAKALAHVRSAFGGMGSLNDLYIHPANGHLIDAEYLDKANNELSELRSDVYKLTVTLQRSMNH